MNKRKKLTLLLLLSITCTVTILVVIFYSLGWRIDMQEKEIVRAGSFYFRVWPRGVDISLAPASNRPEIKRKTFFNATYIENILPGEYRIKIEKERFHPYEKTLKLKPGSVTEAKNITLVKKNPYFSPISEEVDDFYISPDEKRIIFLKKNNIYLFDIRRSEQSLLIRNSPEIEELTFFPSSEKVILNENLILDIEKSSLSPLKVEGEIILGKERILTLDKNTLYEEGNVIAKGVLSALITKEDILYLNKEGFLIKSGEKLNKVPLDIKEALYKIYLIGSTPYIKEDNKLYYLKEEKFNLFLEPVEKVIISKDGEKALFLSKHEIKILFLKEQYNQPQREKGETLFLSRFSEKIENMFWWTSHYLIFNIGEDIMVMEIDNRDKINIFELVKFKNPSIFWSRLNRKLFILSEKTLYVSESLIF